MTKLNIPGVLTRVIDARAQPAMLDHRLARCRLDEERHPGQRLLARERRTPEQLGPGGTRNRGGGAGRGRRVHRSRARAARRQAHERAASQCEDAGKRASMLRRRARTLLSKEGHLSRVRVTDTRQAGAVAARWGQPPTLITDSAKSLVRADLPVGGARGPATQLARRGIHARHVGDALAPRRDAS